MMKTTASKKTTLSVALLILTCACIGFITYEFVEWPAEDSSDGTIILEPADIAVGPSGNIYVAGEDINSPEVKSNHVIAMVFQSSALFNSLTVMENVALYLTEHKIFKDDNKIKEIVSNALEIVGLEGKEDVMPSMISGGMKRRVAAARALVMNPDLILFDEPTAGLDPMMTRTMGDLICDLKNQVQITQIVVTHDIDLAFYVADRIAILSEGLILEVGTPEQIRSSTNAAVLDFIKPQFE